MWFAEQMELKLRQNDHKTDWRQEKTSRLYCLMQDEEFELRNELLKELASSDETRIIKECADIANFAMMIADNNGKKIGR